jgi:hypothetical protein
LFLGGVGFSRFFPLSATIYDTQMTPQMTLHFAGTTPEHNRNYTHQKRPEKAFLALRFYGNGTGIFSELAREKTSKKRTQKIHDTPLDTPKKMLFFSNGHLRECKLVSPDKIAFPLMVMVERFFFPPIYGFSHSRLALFPIHPSLACPACSLILLFITPKIVHL